jgi:hypothetical protein
MALPTGFDAGLLYINHLIEGPAKESQTRTELKIYSSNFLQAQTANSNGETFSIFLYVQFQFAFEISVWCLRQPCPDEFAHYPSQQS